MEIFKQIDKTWTLFLDRDGVINHEKKADYIRNWDEFKFYDGVTEALEIFANIFGTIVMVTNQRGVGKGLMTVEDLSIIHTKMKDEVTASAGRIDKIYFCSSMDNDCYERKPNPGMAYQAQKDFPSIDLGKSLMIGNKPSDMQFGKNAGMYTIFVETTNPEVPSPNPLIDLRCKDLLAAAQYIHGITKS